MDNSGGSGRNHSELTYNNTTKEHNKMEPTNYDVVKDYFDKKWWTVEMVRDAVTKGVLTPEEFQRITKVKYEP
jgi:hypothetical protein